MKEFDVPFLRLIAYELVWTIVAGQPKTFTVLDNFPGYHIVVVAYQYLKAVVLVAL